MPVDLKINCGGSLDSGWLADVYYTGGATFDYGIAANTAGLSEPPPSSVCSCVRFVASGSFSYAIPVDGGKTYRVRIYRQHAGVAPPNTFKTTTTLQGVTVESAIDEQVLGVEGDVFMTEVTGVAPDEDDLLNFVFANLSGGYSRVAALRITEEAGAGDTTDPTGSITSPTEGQTVDGTINVTATASDNVAVDEVEFFVDGVSIGTDSTSAYSVSLNTETLSDDEHEVYAVITDTSGNTYQTPTITFNVDNSEEEPPAEIPVIGSTFAYNEIQLPEYYFIFVPKYRDVTRVHVYEDLGESYNKLNPNAPLGWELHYAPCDRDTVVAAFLDHYNTYQISEPFSYLAKDGETYTNVRYESFEIENIKPNISQIQRVKIVLKRNPA